MNILVHFPVLIVIVPLMSAPVLTALRRPLVAWGGAVVVSWLCLGMALTLLRQVLDEGPIVYLLGNWAAPWGIEYRIDTANALVLVIVSAIAAVVTPYARASIAHEVPRERHYLYYALFMLCLSGMLGMTVTADAFNLFVFLEISSLSTYVLVAMGRDRRALTAAFRYLTLGTIGATFYVIGIGFAYAMTGTLNMADLAARLPGVAHTTTVKAALAFVIVGIALKMAAFPLHLWLPKAYAYAPSVSTAFLAGTATKVSVYVFLRIVVQMFGGMSAESALPVADLLVAPAVVAIVLGSILAIRLPNLKEALAYSSIAQLGYILLGIGIASELGLAAGIVHLFNHAIMKTALFLAVGAMVLRINSVRIQDLAGIGRTMPWTMAAFLVAGLSLIGVPLTVGFVSKWYLVQAALERGWWPVAVLVLASSLLAVAYIWRVVEVAWFAEPSPVARDATEAPLSLLIPTWVLAGASVWFGIDATGTMAVAQSAAEALMKGVAP